MKKQKRMGKMKAYQTGIITKQEFVNEIRKHQEADNFIQGKWFKDGKGCAVGCSLKSISDLKNIDVDEQGDFKRYEDLLGIPEWVARVEECIFEGLSSEAAKLWPLKFSEAINEGADLENIKAPFLIYVVESTLKTFDHDKYPDVKKVIDAVITAIKSGDKEQLVAAADAARAAYDAAADAARAAYDAADAARAAYDAAADAAADAARAAYAAADAARAAYAAADAARAAYDAAADAAVYTAAAAVYTANVSSTNSYYVNIADHFIKLIKGA
jgi:hypothetical protein